MPEKISEWLREVGHSAIGWGLRRAAGNELGCQELHVRAGRLGSDVVLSVKYDICDPEHTGRPAVVDARRSKAEVRKWKVGPTPDGSVPLPTGRRPVFQVEAPVGGWQDNPLWLEIVWSGTRRPPVLPYDLPVIASGRTDRAFPIVHWPHEHRGSFVWGGLPDANDSAGERFVDLALGGGAHWLSRARVGAIRPTSELLCDVDLIRNGLEWLQSDWQVPSCPPSVLIVDDEHVAGAMATSMVGVGGASRVFGWSMKLARLWWGVGCRAKRRGDRVVVAALTQMAALRLLRANEPSRFDDALARSQEMAGPSLREAARGLLKHSLTTMQVPALGLYFFRRSVSDPDFMPTARAVLRRNWGGWITRSELEILDGRPGE